jgi:hypothetical protein
MKVILELFNGKNEPFTKTQNIKEEKLSKY